MWLLNGYQSKWERMKEDRNLDELVIYREQKLEAVALH